MSRNRKGRDRRGKDRRGKLPAGRPGPDHAADPVPPPAGPALVASGGLSLDARLRESVSPGPLAADPAAAVDVIQAAPPAPACAPTESERIREALRPVVAPDAPTAPRTATEPARADPPAAAMIGATLIAYVQDETVAALSHLRALGAARTPAEAIRLQLGEMQRATEATLTCWNRLARDAGRLMTPR